MKTRYSYYSMRFPSPIASLCHCIQTKFKADFLELPGLLPERSTLCVYNKADSITFGEKCYYLANSKTDVCFIDYNYSKGLFFGLINITSDIPEYVLWTTFFNDELKQMIESCGMEVHICKYKNPLRSSTNLICGDFDE